MIIAAALTIWIKGLMTHIGDDRRPNLKAGVALIEAEHHVPIVIIFTDDIASSCPTTPQEELCFVPLLDDDLITFSGGLDTNGMAEISPNIRDYLPHLQEPITNMNISDDSRLLKRKDHVAAWLQYPKGYLDIAFFQHEKANFFRKDKSKIDPARSQCVPHITQFTAPTTGTVTMTITHTSGSPTPIDLNADALVLLLNDVPYDHHPTAKELEEHFTEYVGVLKKRALVADHIAIVRSGDPCGLGPQFPTTEDDFKLAAKTKGIATPLSGLIPFFRILINADPACTNSGWP